jgi:dCTP deaminase
MGWRGLAPCDSRGRGWATHNEPAWWLLIRCSNLLAAEVAIARSTGTGVEFPASSPRRRQIVREDEVILSGAEIEVARERGDLVIEPFSAAQLNPNSYNYRLGPKLICLEGRSRAKSPTIEIDNSGYLLEPGCLYLGHTFEQIGSRKYVTTLLGRSSMGRLGLFLNICADLGHTGALSQWTLELTVVQPLRIYPGMQVGQVAFWLARGSVHQYQGRYQGDLGPVENRDRDAAATVEPCSEIEGRII